MAPAYGEHPILITLTRVSTKELLLRLPDLKFKIEMEVTHKFRIIAIAIKMLLWPLTSAFCVP